MTHVEMLQGIIDSNPMFHGRGEGLLPPALMKPFRVGEWLACTDGHAIAAVLSDEVTEHEPKGSVIHFCTNWLGHDLSDVALPIADLRRVIPDGPDPPICGLCGGSGSVICAVCEGEGEDANGKDCKSCDDGDNDCPEGCTGNPVVHCNIGKLVYNALLLKRFMPVVSGDTFRFIESGINPATLNSGDGPLVLGSDKWRIVVMPMRVMPTDEMLRLVLEPLSEATA